MFITAQCNKSMGYHGEAQVYSCSEIDSEFIICCEMITCSSPDTSGYIITENNSNVSEFDVEVTKCDESNGYFGTPSVSSCGENGEPYILRGYCNFINQECSIPDTTGYILDIKDQSLNNFDITAQCNKSMGYEGEAQVHPCSEIDSEFTLSGCERLLVLPLPWIKQVILLLKTT